MTNIDHFIELQQDAEVADTSGRHESAERYRELARKVYRRMSKEERIIVDTVLKYMEDTEIIGSVPIRYV